MIKRAFKPRMLHLLYLVYQRLSARELKLHHAEVIASAAHLLIQVYGAYIIYSPTSHPLYMCTSQTTKTPGFSTQLLKSARFYPVPV